MSDPCENTNMESQTLSSWTLVNNQGEIMSGDEDSESSGSSIEVVSLEDNEVVSHRLQRGSNSEQVEVVVTEAAPSTDSASEVTEEDAPSADSASEVTEEDAPSADSASEVTEEDALSADSASEVTEEDAPSADSASEVTNSHLEEIFDVAESRSISLNQEVTNSHLEEIFDVAESRSISDDSTKKIMDIKEAILDSENIHETNTDQVQVDVTLSGSFKSQGEASSSIDDVFQFTEDLKSTYACEMAMASGQSCFEESERDANDLVFQVDTRCNLEPDSIDSARSSHQISGDLKLEESHKEAADEASSGACCMELLVERSSSVHCEELNFLQVSPENVIESNQLSRGDSDADSDYVRLDSENIDIYVGEQQSNAERVIIPLRLYRTDSSIGPSFSFMRSDERNDQVAQNENLCDVVDQDRDDDTESSTEEGIDDRIESEQSEAGSMSTQNDVGDLSVFADIGDLPLVAGDVPRNYIHRPNNHLSTVLNIIVVLVAILTMGISLGIIMATDLEIEEWQNAHEFQTRRVNQLDILLKSKTNAYELQFSRVKELEPQLIEIKNTLRTMEKKTKSYERAFDVLAAYSTAEGGTFEKVLHTVLDGVKDYVHCQEESNQLVAVDCHLKLLPYIRSYTALIKSDLSSDKTFNIDLDLLLHKNTNDKQDVQMPSQGITADSPSLLIFSNNKDSQKSQTEEAANLSIEVYNEHPEIDSANLDLETENKGVHIEEKSNTLHSSSESEIQSSGKILASSSEKPNHSTVKTADKEIFRAYPVPIDVRQLQQSLTREQERALHWQQLYLSERRQRERERENEEWEDEREREMAEREKEQIDHVECLKKLMSANLTTLTQHVIKWNVSVFDDFANLSVLLSGISDLQQAVIDSVQRVWKSAEEVIDSLQSKDSKREDKTWKSTIPKKEMIIEYLSNLADHVKRVDMPDHEILVDYLGKMLDHVKHGVEDILSEVYTESATNSVYKIWENAEAMITGFHSQKETKFDEEKVDTTLPDRDHLLSYLSKALNDICHKDNSAFEADSTKQDNDHGQDPEVDLLHKDKTSEYRDFIGTSSTGPHLETSFDDLSQEEEESSKHGFWSRRIGKMLKKTGKTVRKLGRKVAGTWGKIKSVWREKKPFWNKIKNMWHEKKSAFFNTGDRFASTFMKTPLKIVRMCKGKSKSWLKTPETTGVDIHSKCVQKLRKHWQNMVLKDPCQIVGKFSYECNSGRKQCKRDLRTISDSFSYLMKIPNFRRDMILKLNTNDVKIYHKQFQSFQDQWGKSKLLLTTDMGWVGCQLAWWSAAVSASNNGNVDELEDNKCSIINLTDNFCEGRHGITFGPGTSCVAENTEKDMNYVDGTTVIYEDHTFSSTLDDDDLHEVEKGGLKSMDYYKPSFLNMHYEINETEFKDNNSFELHQEESRYQMHLRSEEKKSSVVFDHTTNSVPKRKKNWINTQDDRNEIYPNDRMVEEKYGKQQQDDTSKSSWLFERSDSRRDRFNKKWMKNKEKDVKYIKDKKAQKSDDWFTKQAEERHIIRKDEHKSDWLFERAAFRKKDHDDKYNFRNYDSKRSEHQKFRHTYGKASAP